MSYIVFNLDTMSIVGAHTLQWIIGPRLDVHLFWIGPLRLAHITKVKEHYILSLVSYGILCHYGNYINDISYEYVYKHCYEILNWMKNYLVSDNNRNIINL